jgi:signal transduction histidine kinase
MEGISIIHDDGLGGLWLAGEKGIVRVLVSDLRDVVEGRAVRVKARLFDANSGLAWNAHAANPSQARLARTADGRLWFPTSKGVAVVDPRSIGVNPRPPRILPGTLGYVDASGRMREGEWANGGTVRIPPGSRALRVGFAALHYAAPERVTCSSRLEQAGRMIAERFGPERHAGYELLPPGEYSLGISASNEDGVWTPEGLRLRLVVEPYFWQTTWFMGTLFLGIAGMTAAGSGYWVRQARLKARLAIAERDRRAAREEAEGAETLRRSEARRLQAEAEAAWRREREAVLRDVHDGIGGLASNLHMTASLALHAPEPAMQRAHIRRLGALAQEAVGEVHGLMDFLAADTPNCEAMADEFRRYGRVILEPHGIRLDISVLGAAPEVLATPRLFPQLFRIFKEALANVVKHSRARAVTVLLDAREVGLRMVVEDDGAGLAPGHGMGRGLASMRRRAEGLGGVLQIESPGGVRLVVEVPWTLPKGMELQPPSCTDAP